MATIFNKQYEANLNDLYGKANNSYFVKELFKKYGDVNSAIVSVFDNTGIAGFKFHVPEREEVVMKSEVSTHYVEDNTPVQDHIAQQPVQITLQGLQGDYFYSNHKIESALANVTPIMNLVTPFLPQIDDITAQVKNKITKKNIDAKLLQQSDVNTRILSGSTKTFNFNFTDLFQLFQDLYKVTSAQTRAFLYLEALWKSRMIFTVDTSWKRYENMVITNIKPIRDNNADITDFTVTFQQVRFVQTLTSNIDAAGRTAAQMANTVKKGFEKGKEVDVSTDYYKEAQAAYDIDEKDWWIS